MKRSRWLVVVALIGLSLLMTSPASAGGRGDNFGRPIPFSSIPYSNTHHTNKNATTQTNEPVPSCQAAFSHTFWYAFTAPITEFYFADTVGSDFDTVLALYSYNGSTFSELACDDDSGGAHGGASNTSWLQTPTLTSGTTYYIQVGSFGNDFGYLVFRLND
jgi:hypothetical protein